MDDFLIRALIAGAGVTLLTGPLGAFIVWRRMSFFGDTLAHSSLLGIMLGLVLGLNPLLGVLILGVFAALLLLVLDRRKQWANDTVLGILSHGALAIGLVALAFLESIRIDLMGLLFGDILAVSGGDLVWIYAGGAMVLAALWRLWRPLLSVTVHEDLARAEGLPVDRINLAFLLMIAVTVAIAMKVVGALLIAALLIIPAATARPFSRTPEQMAGAGVLIGWAAVGGGLGLSFAADTPAGPSIITAAVALFALAVLFRASGKSDRPA